MLAGERSISFKKGDIWKKILETAIIDSCQNIDLRLGAFQIIFKPTYLCTVKFSKFN